MDLDAVPQEGNATLAGHRKLMYARAADGRVVGVASAGWEAEEIVTLHAVDAIDAQADAALQRARQGLASPLEYWMHKRRMDVPLLAQTTGLWQWRVRRHLRPATFSQLSAALLARYAQALGLTESELRSLP
ncbi:MAG: hypothetical protein JSS56_18815 [Proteobacteria bacterium]|nr:hypothetical protein [Pseudomonadota bacterium]